jgi:hypothetical protein
MIYFCHVNYFIPLKFKKMQVPTVAWPGCSGKNYTFEVYPISTKVSPGYEGNYIFAKQDGNKWLAVYIGEGVLKDRIEHHLSENNVTKCGATHFHLKLNRDAKARFNDETDLLAGNPEAYSPTGCNVKKGG